MSIRSEVLDVIHGRPHRRVPWFGDLSYYYDSLSRRGELPPRYQGREGEKRLYTDNGVGIYLYTPDVFALSYDGTMELKEQRSPGRIVQSFATPLGSIEAIQDFRDETMCYVYSKHFVRTIEDFRVMRYVHEHALYRENYKAYRECDELWGEDGIGFAMGVACMAPFQKMVSRWAGIQTTVELFMDHREEFVEACTAMEESQGALVEILAQSPAEVVILPENLSSDVTGGSFFTELNMPYYTRIVDRLHAAGKKVAIHIDGRLIPCLGMLSKCGFDIADAVTPEPFGDITVDGLRKAAGDDIVIWGGLPGGIFSRNFSDTYFEGYVRHVLACADDKFVIGVADQVPPDAVPSRIGRVRELVDEGRQEP
jgi:hypothetical protein